MFRICTAFSAALAMVASTAAFAADPIPPQLVGVWATDGAVMKGPFLFEGQAIYLGADGVGAAIGGPPPIGVKIIAAFDAQKNTIEIDIYDGKRKGPHRSISYDPESNTINPGAPKKDQLHRRFDTFSDEMKRGLGLTER